MIVWLWFKRWFLDGWLTTGPQLWCDPHIAKTFTICLVCRSIFPHWLASMTAAEAKARSKIGCNCGSLKIQPVIIPGYQAVWWVFVRGWFVRHIILRKRLWDPRMPLMQEELT